MGNSNCKTWEESYQLAKEYYEEHGDLNVPRNYITKNGFQLGSWISTQKYLYSNNNLSLERIEKLTCIGLDFCSIRHLNTWEESCEIAKEYYEEHGDLNVPYRYKTKDGFHLGAWISIQKQAFANNKLSEDKIKILQNLMDLDTKWLKYYKRLLECYQLYGSLNLSEDFVDENGLGIGKWLHKQVSLYEENKLDLFKKEKFDELNIVELYKTGTLIQITRINKFVYSLCIKLGIDPEINGEVLSSLSLKDFRNTLISLQEKNIPFCDLDGHLNSAFSMKDIETNFILKKTK